MHVLLHPILLSFQYTTGLPLLLGYSLSHFLHKFLTILSLNMTKPPQSIFKHFITPHFTSFVDSSIPHPSFMLSLLSLSHLVTPHALS